MILQALRIDHFFIEVYSISAFTRSNFVKIPHKDICNFGSIATSWSYQRFNGGEGFELDNLVNHA